jgi:hypothetical protein
MKAVLSTAPSSRTCRRISTAMFIATYVWIASGCQTLMPRSPDASMPRMAPSLLQPCPPQTPLEGVTGADVLRKFIEIGEVYNDCRISMDALIRAVR